MNTPPLSADRWYKPGEVAAILNVTRQTVHNMVADGRIVGTRDVGKYGNARLLIPGAELVRLLAPTSAKPHRLQPERYDYAPPPPRKHR